MLRLLTLSALLLTALTWTGCKTDSTDPEDPNQGFDRVPMLTHYADELIIPTFSAFAGETEEMEDAMATFARFPDSTRLEDLREQWFELFSAFQYAAIYDFGPAETNFGTLFENLGSWPVDTTRLEQYIAAGDTSLANFDRDTRGLPALGYLLHGDGQNMNELAAAYAQDPDRLAYLRAVVRNLAGEAERILAAWQGSYRDDFLASDGTSAGSSTSLLYNNFVLGFERLKNFKVGLPLGKRPGQVAAEPQLVEAYYSGRSYELIRIHFNAVESTYYGRSFPNEEDGVGLVEYLETVTGGPELINATEEQIAVVREKMDAIPTEANLAALIADGDPRVEELHTELQRLTRFFKSDMSSLLGISITFDSGDGD